MEMEERDVSFVVPYRADGGRRDELWAWCHARLRSLFPEAEVVAGKGSGTGPFLRSAACNEGVGLASRQVVVVLDADVAFTKESLPKVLGLINAGASWAMGYRYKRHLAKESSDMLLMKPPDTEIPSGLAVDPQYRGTENKTGGTSSYLVMQKEDFLSIGGFDERFVGWNYEDQAFSSVAETFFGPFKATDETIVHLWHEYAPEMVNSQTSPHYKAGEQLFELYKAAKGDEKKMWDVVRDRFIS